MYARTDPRWPARYARPAPGVLPGYCWTGCGKKKSKENGYFCSRDCRSTCAPDRRLVTEHLTKWCQTCQQRLPKTDFSVRVVKTKTGYKDKVRFYCKSCETQALQSIRTRPEAMEKNRERAKDLYYSDPQYRRRKREQGRAWREKVKQDPERYARLKQQKREAYQRMIQRREVARQEQALLDRDPYVVSPEDPMRAWLFEELERYAQERNLSVSKVMPELGRNWQRWKPGNTTNGGRYLSLQLVDKILARLDLPHRLEDFRFIRRSELMYRSAA